VFVWGGVLVLCVCVSVSGVVVLCRCVRVCDLLIFLHRARTLTPNLNPVVFLYISVDQIGSKRLNPRDREWERLVAAHTPHWLALLYVQVVYFLDLRSQMVYIGTRTLTRNLSYVLTVSVGNSVHRNKLGRSLPPGCER